MVGSRLYIHLFSYPFKTLMMDNLADKIDYAQFLHDGSENYGKAVNPKRVRFTLPVVKPNQLVPVIEIFLK